MKETHAQTPRLPDWKNARSMDQPHFAFWMSALTSEGLFAKADIARLLAMLTQELTAAESALEGANKRVAELQNECDAEHDKGDDAYTLIQLIAEGLNLSLEPHQTFNERLLEHAQSLQSRLDAATEKVREFEAIQAESESILFNVGPITCINGKQHQRHDGCLYCRLDAAERDAEWVSFDEQWPPVSKALDDDSVATTDRVLVTNNIKATDRMGRMSHVWFLAPIKSNDGTVVGYDEADRCIHGLTHWKAALSASANSEDKGGGK